MIIIALIFYYCYLRTLKYVFWDSKNKPMLWRISWFLLSFYTLLPALYFSFHNIDYHYYYSEYKIVGYIHLMFVFVTYFGGYWLSLLKIVDKNKREHEIKYFFKTFAIIIICIILYFSI